ncbi:MAG: hypothetical protein IPK53_04565 [bacterium]|nr:hypothetical protein [bacterium]
MARQEEHPGLSPDNRKIVLLQTWTVNREGDILVNELVDSKLWAEGLQLPAPVNSELSMNRDGSV